VTRPPSDVPSADTDLDLTDLELDMKRLAELARPAT